MSLTAEYKEGGNFKPTPAGQYQAVCCEVVDLGFSKKTYKNQQTGADEIRPVHEIQFWFQVNKIDDETGKRFEIRSKPFNCVLSEKSSLKAFLLAWRGHDVTDAEKKPPGLDLESLAKRNALIQVIHTTVGDKTYANIGSIMPVIEGMTPIEPLNYESKQAAETQRRAAAASGNAAGAVPVQQTAPALDGPPSDIPF